MATFMNRTIEDGVLFDEDGKGKVEVCVSIGEFEGTLLSVWGMSHDMVELDFTAAHKLMLALQDALNIHSEHDDANDA
jgi:hypothetical protein